MASVSLNPSASASRSIKVPVGTAAKAARAQASPGETGPQKGPLKPRAIQELFRRWPHVPSRELERIRNALLQCLQKGHHGREHHLSEPARSLLELLTAELARTRGGAR